MFPYIIQGTNLSIFIDGVLHQVGADHLSYNQVVDAIKAGDQEKIRSTIDSKKAVEEFSQGSVTIKGEDVFWRGQPMHGAITKRMVAMLREGFDVSPLVSFMTRLMDNPSKQAVDEAYAFFEACDLPITPDGCFLAFKKVNDNYFDVHSGSVCNKPAHLMTKEEIAHYTPGVIGGKKGEVVVQLVGGVTRVSMPRNMVDDNRDNTCSEGLHFCSKSYLNNFGGSRIVVLKINPADVVSIPSDYNNAKGRCSAYQVIDELKVDADKAFTKAVQTTANGSTVAVQPAPPVIDLSGPKKGSSKFYEGYTAGYVAARRSQSAANAYGAGVDIGSNRAFTEGYDKGWDDATAAITERYVFVAPTKPATPAWTRNPGW